MLKITVDNYYTYKKIFEIIWSFQAEQMNMDVNSEFSPIAVLTTWELKSNSLARRGLRAGLNDILGQLISLPKEYKSKIDDKLKAEGLESLNKLISVIKEIPIKVLKRRKIKDIDEYYIIKEITDDLTYEISQTDRDQLNTMLNDFEIKFNKKNNC